MELYRSEWQRVYQLGLLEKHLVALAWKSQYKVRSAMNPSLCRKGHSSSGTGEVVAAIDMAECRIVARLNAILYGHIFLPSQAGKVVEFLLIYAVGSCANHDACHFGVRQSLIIALLEPLQRCIGVGVGLEVGQILLRSAITPTVELDALVNLLCDALRGRTVGGCEGRIVAKCATPVRDCAITIRATESRIHRHLLHAMAEHTLEIGRIAIEATRIAPYIYLWLVMFVGFRMLVGLVMLILLGFYHSRLEVRSKKSHSTAYKFRNNYQKTPISTPNIANKHYL